MGNLALTSVDMLARAAAVVPYTMEVQLTTKEQAILKWVGRFQQLSTRQVKALVYPGQPFDPQRRAINQLLEHKLLSLVNQKHYASAGGGNRMHVFQIGREGRKLYDVGRRGISRVVNYHALAIADVYISLLEAERAGQATIFAYATEPDSHIEFGSVYLKPDLYVDVGLKANGKRRAFWVEVDLGSERQKQVMEQITAYKMAFDASGDYPLPLYPRVVFLAVDDERAQEINYWLQRATDLPVGMVTVGTVATAVDTFASIE